jgi:hypothetical protein
MTASMGGPGTAGGDDTELSFAAACALLGVTAPELLRRMSEEKLPGRLVDGAWRYSRAELERWLDTRSPGRESPPGGAR